MSTEAEQVVGLATALVLYSATVTVMVRRRRAGIAALPSEWRNHVQLRDGYERLLADCPLLRQFRNRRTLASLLPFAIATGVYAVGGVAVWIEIVSSAVVAAGFTQSFVATNQRQMEETATELGLAAPARDRRRRRVWIASSFIAWTARIAFGGFLGGAVGTALR